ncbi:hypothetical protein STCU_03326 [Strigomonas culicis]|uniref:SET domain-containing protein n=1 Tax=Strigomonas culicis TaxID=28005 RepID=S9TZ44_9TRYP|nr:hypothetical protein STCU_08430 [Strigomonas culicis]EPY31696.1 hypothetical protein STCU_03326 [Strigomonas culicis]|eukprot:EPY21928.1 hypothetical protein STCU_08430 [Strigomonas culicis]
MLARKLRSAKFAEYLSTYAILHHIGIHETTLIEKRDSGTDFGVYVRDACDADTTLLVIPSKRFAAVSTIARLGAPVRLVAADACQAVFRSLDAGLVAYLCGSCSSQQWVEWCWRVALEKHRGYSPLWGWLQSLPTPEAYQEERDHVDQHCRLHHPSVYPFFQSAQRKIEAEVRTAYEALARDNLMPSFDVFHWAVAVLLTRGIPVPTAWPPRPHAADAEAPGIEPAVVPYVDLMNGADGAPRRANAELEVARSMDELPRWYTSWVTAEGVLKGTMEPEKVLPTLLEQYYFLCVVLRKPLRASEEVLVAYQSPFIETEVLSEEDGELLSRFVKYLF